MYKLSVLAVLVFFGYAVPIGLSIDAHEHGEGKEYLARHAVTETQPVLLYRHEDYLTTAERAALVEIADQRAGGGYVAP